jgi:hypothetical protein
VSSPISNPFIKKMEKTNLLKMICPYSKTNIIAGKFKISYDTENGVLRYYPDGLEKEMIIMIPL